MMMGSKIVRLATLTIACMMCSTALLAVPDDTDLFEVSSSISSPARIMLVVDTSMSMGQLEGDRRVRLEDINNRLTFDFGGDCTGVVEGWVDADTNNPVENADRKICIVRDVLLQFLDPSESDSFWPDNFEVGLAHYAEPGALIVQSIATLGSISDPTSNRNQLIAKVRALTTSGYTPLVGSYLEIMEYLTGGVAVTKAYSESDPEVWAAEAQYEGVELGAQCGMTNNHIIFLTDGESTCEKGAYITEDERNNNGVLVCSDNAGDVFGDELSVRVNSFVGQDRFSDVELPSGASCTADAFSFYETLGDPYKTYWGCLSMMSAAIAGPKEEVDGETIYSGVLTHVIAYDLDRASEDTKKGMEAWATGNYVPVSSREQLENAFQAINEEAVMPGTFVIGAGGVAVSNLNRFSHLDEFYFAKFMPSSKPFWYGNLKKYFFQISAEGELGIYTDRAKTESAVDESGSFLPDVTTEWSELEDGNIAMIGGAAGKINDPSDNPGRNLFVYYGDSRYQLNPDNAAVEGEGIDSLQAAMLSTYRGFYDNPDAEATNTAVTTYNTETLEPSLQWLLGFDVNNEWQRINDQIKSLDLTAQVSSGVRSLYGAPLHSSPVLVNYQSRDSDGLPLSNPENVVFVSTNDGKLYAVDSANGEEYLAYMPEAMLKRSGLNERSPVEKMYEATKADAADGPLIYGLDSTWTVWRQDVDGNGNIDEGDDSLDFVYLYGGMRRGGHNYYILDATKVHGSEEIEELAVIEGGQGEFLNNGQSWSEPRLAIIPYNGVATAVFIVGGGYDTSYDSGRVAQADLPAKGAQIYVIAARNSSAHDAGDVLWWASSESNLSDTTHAQIEALKFSVPSSVKTVDIDGNGYLDFFYVGDMGGQIHRFDINQGNTGAGNLFENVNIDAGGTDHTVVAQLGVEGATISNENDRRFFYPPSVAKMRCPEGFCMALAIGSGWRSNPTDVSVTEKFFFLMDYEPFSERDEPIITEAATIGDGTTKVVQELAKTDDSETPIVKAATEIGIRGYSLALGGTDYEAEKLLGSPLIVGGTAYFSTYYRPTDSLSRNTCEVSEGASAVYAFVPGDSKALTLQDGLSQNVAGSIQTLISILPDFIDTDGDGTPDQELPGGLQGGVVSGTGSVGPAPLSLDHIRRTRWSQQD